MTKPVLCELCGEPMPEGEQMFMYHGHSGDCPKPPKPLKLSSVEEILKSCQNPEIIATGAEGIEFWENHYNQAVEQAKSALKSLLLSIVPARKPQIKYMGTRYAQIHAYNKACDQFEQAIKEMFDGK